MLPERHWLGVLMEKEGLMISFTKTVTLAESEQPLLEVAVRVTV